MESGSSDTPLFKKTLVTAGMMLGACVVFVGTIALAAVLIVGKAVGPSEGTAMVPADNVHGGSPEVAAQPGAATNKPVVTPGTTPGMPMLKQQRRAASVL